MSYEKDNILNEALEYIISVRYEGQINNSDYLKYWAMLTDDVLNITTASFRAGLLTFNERLKNGPNSRELTGYHFRLMTTLINNNSVISASDELYSVFSHNLRHEIETDVVFDIIKNDVEIHYLTGFEKILLLMHIYQDRIDCALANMLPQLGPKGKNKR